MSTQTEDAINTENEEEEEDFSELLESGEDFSDLLESGEEYTGETPSESRKYNDEPAMRKARCALATGKRIIYSLDKIAEEVGFEPKHTFYSGRDKKYHTGIQILPPSVMSRVKKAYPQVMFKKWNLKSGEMGVMVYRKR